MLLEFLTRDQSPVHQRCQSLNLGGYIDHALAYNRAPKAIVQGAQSLNAQKETTMNRLLGIIGCALLGYIGWYLGGFLGSYGAVSLGSIGAGTGLYLGRKISRDHF